MVRRLPVIRDPAEDPDAVHRPRWRWVLIGAAFALVLWVPLAVLTMPLGATLAAHLGTASRDELTRRAAGPASALLAAAPPLLSFFVAAAAGGALLLRFGAGTGRWDGAAAGALGGAVATLLTALVGRGLPLPALLSALFLLAAAGAAGGYAGGAWGARRR